MAISAEAVVSERRDNDDGGAQDGIAIQRGNRWWDRGSCKSWPTCPACIELHHVLQLLLVQCRFTLGLNANSRKRSSINGSVACPTTSPPGSPDRRLMAQRSCSERWGNQPAMLPQAIGC